MSSLSLGPLLSPIRKKSTKSRRVPPNAVDCSNHIDLDDAADLPSPTKRVRLASHDSTPPAGRVRLASPDFGPPTKRPRLASQPKQVAPKQSVDEHKEWEDDYKQRNEEYKRRDEEYKRRDLERQGRVEANKAGK
ncbi:uncharacterized protein AB675_4414 [Cyphellophora attinorum]|uniref:Uncharacterized protein n=1 Tax=Cyphellophora attinorum TaxID=1664694 RepID=A0A0N1GZH7_9EURO|nr:uncharacterized protein AB675_4414 [Phialophora attinorum]KPI36593.1 hypothetical protein AB675_4414 [Phialophora attinorum]